MIFAPSCCLPAARLAGCGVKLRREDIHGYSPGMYRFVRRRPEGNSFVFNANGGAMLQFLDICTV